TSTPCSLCANSEGSRFALTAMRLPLITTASSVASTVPSKIPCTESYLKRCASVFGLSTSFSSTTSKSRAPRLMAARRMLRPMRPKPLMAKRAMSWNLPGGGTHRARKADRQGSLKNKRAAPGRSELRKVAKWGHDDGAAGAHHVPDELGLRGPFALVLQILRDQVDQFGGQREQLLRRVAAGTQLLVEGTREDARARGTVEVRDAGCRFSRGRLGRELVRHLL